MKTKVQSDLIVLEIRDKSLYKPLPKFGYVSYYDPNGGKSFILYKGIRTGRTMSYYPIETMHNIAEVSSDAKFFIRLCLEYGLTETDLVDLNNAQFL